VIGTPLIFGGYYVLYPKCKKAKEMDSSFLNGVTTMTERHKETVDEIVKKLGLIDFVSVNKP